MTTRKRSSASRVTVTSPTILPAPVEELGVDDRADGTVDPVATDPLEQGERPGARHLELAERRHVDDPQPLADRRVLDRDAIVERRPCPAERALLLAGPPPLLARA